MAWGRGVEGLREIWQLPTCLPVYDLFAAAAAVGGAWGRKRNRLRDRQRGREWDTQTDRQTNRQRKAQTDRGTDRQTERGADRETDRQTKRGLGLDPTGIFINYTPFISDAATPPALLCLPHQTSKQLRTIFREGGAIGKGGG